MHKQPILVIGLFSKDAMRTPVYRSAADQLAELFQQNQQPVICTSYHPGKLRRLWDTLTTILFNKNKFTLAILPLYGTKPSFTWQEIAARLLKLLHKKIILVVHGGSIPERMQANARPFLKALQRADKIVCPSPFMQNVLQQYGITPVVIENVLALSDYPFIEKETFRPRILWMRAFEAIYNPAMAIRVIKILKKLYPDIYMIMAGGDKGLLRDMKDMIRQENLEKNISLPGYINLEQKITFAHSCDIFISTNQVDNAPVTLIEFMALGMPVISTNVGGIPYIIGDGINGFTVPADDAAAMANKIIELISNPKLAKQVAGNARAFAQQFDAAAVMEKWNLLIEKF